MLQTMFDLKMLKKLGGDDKLIVNAYKNPLEKTVKVYFDKTENAVQHVMIYYRVIYARKTL